jgi:putative component of membrane protein insertase Oxa1/YidC/SpoIIIJ protein YidD
MFNISLYQKFISPRKGFRCAYGVVNDTHGCSGSVKNIIIEKGLIEGQFARCKEAASYLKGDAKKKWQAQLLLR